MNSIVHLYSFITPNINNEFKVINPELPINENSNFIDNNVETVVLLLSDKNTASASNSKDQLLSEAYKSISDYSADNWIERVLAGKEINEWRIKAFFMK